MEEIRNSRVANLTGRAMTCRSGTGLAPEGSLQRQLPPSGGAKKFYAEVIRTNTDKRFKLLVKKLISPKKRSKLW